MNTIVKHEGDKVWLEGIEGWSPSEKVSSVHAALEAVMNSIGEDFSYDFLVGISSLAFRMQTGGFCPSSPHPACGYRCIERSLQVLPWQLKGYGLDNDKETNLQELNEHIIQSIDRGIPVIIGEEDDGLIIGYHNDNMKYICFHPWHHRGIQPFVTSNLREICWGFSVVIDRKTGVIDRRNLVIESLRQAVKMAKTKYVDRYHVGLTAWEQYIKSLKNLDKRRWKVNDDDILGNAWIYLSLVQYRDVAAKYLLSIEDYFGETATIHLRNASTLYRQISSDILRYDSGLEKVTGEYNALKESVTWTKATFPDQIIRLEKALPLERQAVDEIEKAVSAF